MLYLVKFFIIPILVLTGIILYLVTHYIFNYPGIADVIAILPIVLGSYKLVVDIFRSLRKGRFVLDYIAVLAIFVSLMSGEYLVASIIALMLASGETLEAYGIHQAKKSLTKLIDRIPNEVTLADDNKKIKISQVKIGQKILVKKGEVISLDGKLISDAALIDESSLTGEPYTVEMVLGDLVRSGTVNVGAPIIIEVTKEEKDSTYTKIINLVKNAQDEKSPLVRLADRYSVIFTLITLIIAAFAYFYSQGDFTRILAVLVIATPCPLILATPIALIGGVNAASKRNIIIKKLASLEILSKATALIFDKTGTITLGIPTITKLEMLSKNFNQKEILQIADAIERNSLHPMAKAIVKYAGSKNVTRVHASNIEEIIGSGISGVIEGKKYTLSKIKESDGPPRLGKLGEVEAGMEIGLFIGKDLIAKFMFDDQIKPESKKEVNKLKEMGLQLFIFTGDKLEAAKRVVDKLGQDIIIKAQCTPEDKQKGIADLKNQKIVTAMVGDGINDAPALALADVGIVFASEEQTAASEAADVVILGSDFEHVYNSINIAKKTIKIALQSILFGIGLSITGMVFASLGFITPIVGAGLQEVIDVAVIINALRSSRTT